MAQVSLLQLDGSESPQLSFSRLEVDELDNGRPRQRPLMRIFQLAPDRKALDWAVLVGLRNRAVHMLGHRIVHDELARANRISLSISDPVRLIESSIETLRAGVAAGRPIVVMDISIPEGGDRFDARTLLAEWEEVLADDAPGGTRRIERAPPQPPQAGDAASVFLRELLADEVRFLDSASVGRALTGNPEHANPKMATTRARQRRQIFGIWDGNAYRYPAFQFSHTGQPRAEVASLVEWLPRDADGTNRDAALWLYSPDAALRGNTPAEMFPVDPEAVIELARARRDGGDDLD